MMIIKSYDDINWLKARKELLVNQEKLVEAYRYKNNEAVVEMQSLITYSFAAKSKPIESIIRDLNPKIRGWGNYFRISYKVLADLVWHKMWKWARTKHKERNAEWIFLKYTRESKWRTRHWGTSEMLLQDLSTMTPLKIFHMPMGLNPYVEEERKILELRIWKDYKGDEDGTLREKVLRAQGGHCLCCGSLILGSEEKIELHHIQSILDGGTWSYKNLCLLHETCHKQVTKNKLLNKKIAHRRKIGKDWITL